MDNIDNVIPLFKTGPEPSDEKLQAAVELWQAMYYKRGQSLTDPKTAASLRVAIEMMALILDGACAHDVISEEQRDQLWGLVDMGNAAADAWQK